LLGKRCVDPGKQGAVHPDHDGIVHSNNYGENDGDFDRNKHRQHDANDDTIFNGAIHGEFHANYNAYDVDDGDFDQNKHRQYDAHDDSGIKSDNHAYGDSFVNGIFNGTIHGEFHAN